MKATAASKYIMNTLGIKSWGKKNTILRMNYLEIIIQLFDSHFVKSIPVIMDIMDIVITVKKKNKNYYFFSCFHS